MWADSEASERANDSTSHCSPARRTRLPKRGPADVARSRPADVAVGACSGIRARVFAHARSSHDTTGSNQPPDSWTHPVRSRRASVIAASAIGRPELDDDLVQACTGLAGTAPAPRRRCPEAAAGGRTPARRPGGCRGRARRARRRPTVTGAAPSRRSWLVPAAARLRTEAGHGHDVDRALDAPLAR